MYSNSIKYMNVAVYIYISNDVDLYSQSYFCVGKMDC